MPWMVAEGTALGNLLLCKLLGYLQDPNGRRSGGLSERGSVDRFRPDSAGPQEVATPFDDGGETVTAVLYGAGIV